MTADEYLEAILAREAIDTSMLSPVWTVKRELDPLIARWGGAHLQSVSPSGSFAKGTANRAGTDLDLFISMWQGTPLTLSEVYHSLHGFLAAAGYRPRSQNVSIGVRIGSMDVDLVPGRKQPGFTTDHSLYRRKADTWTKTNVSTHINFVRESGRQKEIRIIKLWRLQKQLDFPSFYLELAVIHGLRLSFEASLAARIMQVFRFLEGAFASARFVDPANTNNVISDDLSDAEKLRITFAARAALQASHWGEIVE